MTEMSDLCYLRKPQMRLVAIVYISFMCLFNFLNEIPAKPGAKCYLRLRRLFTEQVSYLPPYVVPTLSGSGSSSSEVLTLDAWEWIWD